MVERFLEKEPQYHTYNMVSGQKISLQEICDLVFKISGKKLLVYVCKEEFVNEYTASNRRFMNEK